MGLGAGFTNTPALTAGCLRGAWVAVGAVPGSAIAVSSATAAADRGVADGRATSATSPLSGSATGSNEVAVPAEVGGFAVAVVANATSAMSASAGVRRDRARPYRVWVGCRMYAFLVGSAGHMWRRQGGLRALEASKHEMAWLAGVAMPGRSRSGITISASGGRLGRTTRVDAWGYRCYCNNRTTHRTRTSTN